MNSSITWRDKVTAPDGKRRHTQAAADIHGKEDGNEINPRQGGMKE